MSAVSTINLNDFLVQKDSGDVVTGADWNKLVALFHAVNNNAEALLNTIKDVDTNAANIAQVTQGAVPDNSIGYDKLEKIGGIKNVYTFTEDITPKTGVTYYTLEDGVYSPHENLAAFESGVQYYELRAVVTRPAIADADVVGDGVIHGYHCAELILGSLLNDSVTVYTDKGILSKFPAYTSALQYDWSDAPTAEHTITFEKQHKAFVIISNGTIILLHANPNTPDVYIGLRKSPSNGDVSGLDTIALLGEEKHTRTPQSIYTSKQQDYVVGLLGVTGARHVQLQHCYYDYASKTIKFTVKHLHTSYAVGEKFNYPEVSYSFGNLIIGL